MTPAAEALLAFALAAGLLTVTPGADTALVLRTAAVEGPRRALAAGLGVSCGCLAWGVVVAVGLGALLAASELAYAVLRWAGAAYLLYLGGRMLLDRGGRSDDAATAGAAGTARHPAASRAGSRAAWPPTSSTRRSGRST